MPAESINIYSSYILTFSLSKKMYKIFSMINITQDGSRNFGTKWVVNKVNVSRKASQKWWENIPQVSVGIIV